MRQLPEAMRVRPQDRPDPELPFDGRHRLVERIARGAMGEVHVAHDTLRGRTVALKRLRPEALELPGALAHFREEYRTLCTLEHPRIIEVYDYGLDRELPYYTMELLDGEDLRELSPLDYREACRCLRDVASSLALLHARRLLHRDLSPRNVRRTSDGRCKLLDFGTLAPFGEPKNVAGTPPFLAPEALEGEALDQRADLYSLGALAYWLLTGHHAHDVQTFAELPASYQKRPPRMRRYVPEIPPALDNLVLSLLEPSPMGRPSSAAEVIEGLNAIAGLELDGSLEVVASYLAGATLVGRAETMESIERRIESALEGRGVAVRVDGDPGIGKSRVLREAALEAKLRGLTVVSAAARDCPDERALVRELAASLELTAPLAATGARAGLEADLALLLSPAAKREARTDGSEARARAQHALSEWFARVAHEQPLLVTVDDLDHADDFSAAFVASLAIAAAGLPLVVLATVGRKGARKRPAAVNAFTTVASRLPLAGLDATETLELMTAFFGDAPNVERLGHWMFRNSRGNPALCVELTQHLIQRRVLRYQAGSWVLPDRDIIEEVPGELREALALRLERLSRDALALAAVVAVHGGSAPEALVHAAGRLDDARTAAALRMLRDAEVVRSAGGRLVFTLDAMREAVEQQIEAHDVRRLHGQLADALLASGEGDSQAQLLAGWHLVHTMEELRGADILAKLGPSLMRQGLAATTATRALEKALEVYERHGRPLDQRLRLRAQLVLGGYLVDPALARRYGEDTLALLEDACGMGLVRRFSTRLGKTLGPYLAFGWLSMRRLLLPPARRPPNIVASLHYLCRSVISLVGVRATGLDAPGSRALADLVAPLAQTRVPGASETALACHALALQAWGREAELEAALDVAIRRLDGLRVELTPGITVHDANDIRVGLWLGRGINCCYAPGTAGLDAADRVEAIGTQLSGVCADRIRMVYYTVRGYRDEAEHFRQRIEQRAVQGGTTWQVHAFALPIEGISASFFGDVVAARRALERLEALVEDTPSMIPLRDLCYLTTLYAREQHAEAVEAGQRFLAAHPPRTVIGWAIAYTAVAGSLIGLGRYQEARVLAKRGLDAVPEEDLHYHIMYMPLEGIHALALGLAGDDTTSHALLSELERRLTEHGEHSHRALLGEYRARLARMRGDMPGMRVALRSLEDAARRSRNPALIAHASRVAAISSRMTHGSEPPTLPGHRAGPVELEGAAIVIDDAASESVTPAAGPPDGEQTIVTRVLLDCRPGEQRAKQALRMVAQYAGASVGYMVVSGAAGPRLAASLAPGEPPEALERRMGELLLSGRSGTQCRLRAATSAEELSAPRDYGVFLLPDADGGCAAAVALEEGSEPLARLRQELLREVGETLAAPEAR